MRQVRNLLSNPNLMRLPEAQEMWRQALEKFRWDDDDDYKEDTAMKSTKS